MSAVQLSAEGRVATLVLARPEVRNAFDLETLEQLDAAVAGVEAEAERSVLVLTGEGGTFCAGADLSAISAIEDEAERREAFLAMAPRLATRLVALLDRLEASRLVTVAGINGHAVGGGWLLALSCDLRLAASGAEFWFPEVGFGRLPTPRVEARLLEAVGVPKAKEIMMLGRRYSAAQAVAMGLLNGACEPQDLAAELAALAAELAAVDPAVLDALKRRFAARSTEPTEGGAP